MSEKVYPQQMDPQQPPVVIAGSTAYIPAPPPNPQYIPPPPPPGTTTTFIRFGPYPQPMTCPSCNARIVSMTETKTGTLTWAIAAGLCFIGCSLGCCLIPFCVDDCKDTLHTCPNCNCYLGEHKKF